ncbi:MAG TPA: NadS family protein [Acidobacteriota bacterium]|nr:NadS family protein [Acidobacteriota bacterium]
MKENEFEQLLDSVREAGKIRRNHLKPGRVFHFEPADVKKIRERLSLSQTEFALMIGVSVATLRNWEQGRRVPEGPARALLKVAAERPDALVDALSD